VQLFKKLLLASFVAALVLVVNAAPAKAYSNNNMIDNAVFDAKDAMNESQIRSFIAARPNTCLTRTGSGLGGGNIFDEPMDYWTYGPNKVDAARVIYKAAQYNGVNPRVIIATLQKEQSLFTDSDCLDPAGYDSLNKAMGTGCFEGNLDPVGNLICPDPAYAGFQRQIMKGIWQLAHDRHRSEGDLSWGNPNTSYNYTMVEGYRQRCASCPLIYYDGFGNIDGIPTKQDNGATAALYRYTPHLSLNFPYWFEYFFGAGSTRATPGKPQVVKGVTGTELYAVWGTTKYYLPTYDMMIAWGLHRTPISTVADSYLTNLQDGGQLSNIAKSSDEPNSPLFLFDDGKRYPIPLIACRTDLGGQPTVGTSWALDCFNSNVSKAYPSSFIQSATVQDITLPTMIAFGESVWKLEAGKKRRIVDGLVTEVLGGWNNVRWMKDLNANQPEGKMLMRNGYTVRYSNSPVVYQYDNGQLNTIPSPTELVAWGIATVHDFPVSYNNPDPLPLGTNINQVAQAPDGTKYLIDKGYKLSFAPDADPSNWPLNSPTTALSETLAGLSTIPLSSVYLSDGGQIFTVYGSKRYVFPTMDDFFKLGFKPSLIRRVSVAIESLPGVSYGGMHMASGRLYKINNNLNQIYITQGSHSLYVNSINYPGLPYDKIITVDPITGSRYPVTGTYQP